MGSLLRSAMVLKRSATVLKLIKYSTASAVAVVVGQTVLIFGLEVMDWAALSANLVSVTIGSIPNYTINRYWTWRQSGKNRLWGEIIPFWAMAILGVILSMLAVALADRVWGTTVAIAAASLAGFGVVWVAKFLVLDKVMWRVVRELHPELDIDDDQTESGRADTQVEPTDGLQAHPNGAHSTNGAYRPNGSHDVVDELERAAEHP